MKIKKAKRKQKSKLKNVNQSPGKVIYVGDKDKVRTLYQMISYDQTECDNFETDNLKEVFARWNAQHITWLNITGLTDTKQIEAVGKHFGIHDLVLEDLVNTQQRPKVDEYENYIFLVLKMIWLQNDTYVNEHFNLIIGKDYVLTFQETENDIFDKLRKRIRIGSGVIRLKQAGFLMYNLLDVIIDHYFLVIEHLGLQLEQLEDIVLFGDTDEDTVRDLQELKPEILQLRKVIFPLREMSDQLKNSNHPLILKNNFNYWRDLHDNCVQAVENVEMYREMMGSVTSMYISTLNNKMNEVMKVLTIMASIFIPLTFIVGVYGMNFENMPELHAKYGYYYILGLMLLISLGMLWYFKRKKWF